MGGRVANQDPCRTLASGLCKHKENVGRDPGRTGPLMFLELWMHINERCKQGLWKSTWRLFKQRRALTDRQSCSAEVCEALTRVFSMKSCLMPCVSLSSAQLPKGLREKSFSVAVMSYIIMRSCVFKVCWQNNCKTDVCIGRLPPHTFHFFFYIQE